MNSSANVLNAPVMGSQSPSVEHLPAEIGTTALADECLEFVEECGLELDPWQARCLRSSLSEVDDDLWAAFLVGVIVGRQNGKGTLLEAREIAGLFHIGESLILHSAHEFKTCYEHFLRVVNLIESVPDLDKHVQKVRRGVGEQAVELRNGNRLRFIARTGGSGRGMSAPCVVLDEAMFLTEAQIGAIMPTLSAQANPQMWFTSSAPLAQSETLHRLRTSAIEGTGNRLYYAEWGNDADADPADPEALARANPALGRRLFLDFIDTEREAMSPAEFARERLGVPEVPEVGSGGPIDVARWLELTDRTGEVVPGSERLCLDAPHRGRAATFGLAARLTNGLFYVEQRDHLVQERLGTVIERAKELTEGHGCPLTIVQGSPAEMWVGLLEEAKVPLDRMSRADYGAGCLLIQETIADAGLRHSGAPELANAIEGLAVRTSGDVDVWARRNSSANIAPFVAVTCALARVPQGGVTIAPFVI